MQLPSKVERNIVTLFTLSLSAVFTSIVNPPQRDSRLVAQSGMNALYHQYVSPSFVRIFSLLSAILHLGNIRYKKKTYRDDSIDICNPEVLPTVSELLEVSSGTQQYPSPNLQIGFIYIFMKCSKNTLVQRDLLFNF